MLRLLCRATFDSTMGAIQNEILKRIIETNRMYGDVHVFQFQYINEQLNTRFLEQYSFRLFPAN